MRTKALVLTALAIGWMPLQAQEEDDPVIMVINGEEVPRSEFEYSFNKNNTDGVIDKKSVEEYVDLFVNYKLKVMAALDAKMDTLSSFKKEFAQYRDQQIKPNMVTDSDIELEAISIYEQTKEDIGPEGLIQTRHIFLSVKQQATEEEQSAVKERIDSIYGAIKGGADFAELATAHSQDRGTAKRGGLLPWMSKGQAFEEYEQVAFGLKEGEISEPFISPAGYHIVEMVGRKQLEPYDTLRNSILDYIEKRNMRMKIATDKVSREVERSKKLLTQEEVMQRFTDSICSKDIEMRYLIKEYYDGLLLYEISNKNVWQKASKDEKGLEAYFEKNKKKYVWDEPRFKGMAYHVKFAEDVDSVKLCVEGLAFADWNKALKDKFNSDSILRIRVEKGIFRQGDNALVDKEVFGRDTISAKVEGYPIDATYGKLLKKPEEYTDVKGLVTADYQEQLEKEWVAALRKQYAVEVRKDVLKTVNNH